MLVPLLQIITGGNYAPNLNGGIVAVEKPRFTKVSWLNLSYQQQYEKWFNENFSFRAYYVRIYNQFYYSLFHIPKARDVLFGKDNYLFEKNYIDEYLGRNFKGDDKIDRQIKLAKILSDTLTKRKIALMIIFAPGKATFYPEYLPEEYSNIPKKKSNYQSYIEKCNKYHLNYLDFNSYFLSLKNKTKYPLYSNCGIHWTNYGVTLAIDSMIRYIEKLKNIHLPQMKINGIEVSSKPRFTDYDLADGLNLIFKIPHPDYAYPKVEFVSDKNSVKPKVLVIADSYYWNIFGPGYSSNLFTSGGFWYYNEIAYFNINQSIPVSSFDKKKEIEKQDLIILMSTDANLHKFSWGFIEGMCKEYGIKL